jgi:hypothetical protein
MFGTVHNNQPHRAIANVLRETPAARLVVAVMHIPLQNYLDPSDPSMNVSDKAESGSTRRRRGDPRIIRQPS